MRALMAELQICTNRLQAQLQDCLSGPDAYDRDSANEDDVSRTG
jgi:hypothetical protein